MQENMEILTDAEYNRLIRRLEFHDTTRNSLLTFSFTAVLTVLGIAIPMKMDTITSWICILPYFLILPFGARISYYRISSAHISSFLRTYARNKMKFEEGAQEVKEDFGEGYKLIAWLVNHEMVLLGAACSIVFYIKFIPAVESWGIYEHVGVIIPVVLLRFIYRVVHSSNNYTKLTDEYKAKWEQQLDKVIR